MVKFIVMDLQNFQFLYNETKQIKMKVDGVVKESHLSKIHNFYFCLWNKTYSETC